MLIEINLLSLHLFIGFDEIVQMLIDKDAHLNAVDDQSNSALHYAAENGKLKIYWVYFNTIQMFGTLSNFYSSAANSFKGFLKIVQMLVEKGAKLDIVNKGGSTVLDAAFHATKGNLNTVQIIYV